MPLAIGAIGGIFTASSVKTWYLTLEKPDFNPPSAVFGPVWSSLYIMIGIASYLVWRERKSISNLPAVVGLYFCQLLLNLGWSFIFFGQKNIGLALVEIIILWIVIIINALVFYRIHKWAGLLFVPYILWVSFASFLTYSIYILN
ncbi:MAG: tryptophan-rich sensory protein [Sphingobacteriales bacterium]|nr:MAG: tryptophan-rich sensory protein [Sphingobacteriales bacterium]